MEDRGLLSMSKELFATLALAKQAYEELVGLIPIVEIARHEFGTGARRERVQELLKKLDGYIYSVDQALTWQVEESGDTPIVTLPAAHRKFYKETLEPVSRMLREAHWEMTGIGALARAAENRELVLDETFLLNAISWGLERWHDMLGDEERDDWLGRGFNIEGAFELVGMPWFRPDEWRENLNLLRPVLLDKPSGEIRDHVRYRLTEIYRAFTFGLWMAAIVLCRSLIEFSIKENSPRLGIETTQIASNGNREEKSLRMLGDEVAVRLSSLKAPIETVRETGNRIVHPKKRDVIAFPTVLRAEVLDCIRASRLIVEELYCKAY